jgi:rod shape-determining protein MreC
MFRDSRRVRQLLGLMILTSITLITIDYRGGANSPFRGLRRSAGTVFGPIERGVSAAVRPIDNALSALGNVGNTERDNKRLRAELAAVEFQKRTNADKQRQYDDAMRLLKLANDGQYRTIAAHVIAAAPTNFSWTVTIDAGSDRGVRYDQTVVNADGLVGRVIDVSKFSSTVLLAIDLKLTVGGRLSYTGETGMVSGNGPTRLKFEVTPATADVKAGQPVVTAGSSFVPGVPIGEVIETRAQPGAIARTVILKPYVNFAKLDLVGVVVKQERKTDLDALVPSPPPATATPSSTPSLPAPCPSSTAPSAGLSTAPKTGQSSAPPATSAPAIPCLSSYVPAAGTPGSTPSTSKSP